MGGGGGGGSSYNENDFSSLGLNSQAVHSCQPTVTFHCLCCIMLASCVGS